MTLSKRLEAILSMIEQCQRLLDIGSDHAFLCIEAVKRGISKTAIAADNKQGPLDISKNNIKNENMSDLVIPVLSDGATNISKPCDCWVIAGLGASTITQILNDSLDKAKLVDQIIISTHSKVEEVRAFLYTNGFNITNQRMIKDGKYYPILKTNYTGIKYDYTAYDLIIGNIEKDSTYYQWIDYQRKHYLELSKLNSEFDLYYQLFNQESFQNQSQDMD